MGVTWSIHGSASSQAADRRRGRSPRRSSRPPARRSRTSGPAPRSEPAGLPRSSAVRSYAELPPFVPLQAEHDREPTSTPTISLGRSSSRPATSRATRPAISASAALCRPFSRNSVRSRSAASCGSQAQPGRASSERVSRGTRRYPRGRRLRGRSGRTLPARGCHCVRCSSCAGAASARSAPKGCRRERAGEMLDSLVEVVDHELGEAPALGLRRP